MGQTTQDVDRNPPRPEIHVGVCIACGHEGHVFTSRYALSGGRTAFMTLCLDWQSCAERGGSDELTDELGD